MSMLLNRKYGSRLECLYYILTSLYKKYGTTKEFSLKNIKYDEDDEYNVHNYCKQLIDCVGIKCCPFLVNPLNASKCYATQSVDSDSTKSKAVSDIGGSLEALGFISRSGKTFKISESGERWVNSDFNSKEWEEIALKGVLSYGVVIGLLSKLRGKSDKFFYSGIYLSYPKTDETVVYTDGSGVKKYINISTDSKKDSNTRTMSRIIGWCVAVGLLEPQIEKYDNSTRVAHLRYRDFLNSSELTVRSYRKTALCDAVFHSKRYVENPLSYSHLHKNVGSLRENGGEDLRRATMKYNRNILDRRFVFVWALNHYSKLNKPLSFSALIKAMEKDKEAFFSPGNTALDIMTTEAEIADIAGIPFDIDGTDSDLLIPLTIINERVLREGSDERAVGLAEKVVEEMEKNK